MGRNANSDMSMKERMLAALESALGSDFGLSATGGLALTGYFPPYLVGPTRLSFNFADSGSGSMAGCQLFWLASARDHGHAAHNACVPGLGGCRSDGLADVGFDCTRADRHAADTPLAEHHGRVFGQAHQTVFGGGVSRTGHTTDQSGARGDIDDHAAAMGQHDRDGQAHGVHGPGQVDSQDPVPGGVIHLIHRLEVIHDPGVVDQHIHRAESF